MYMNAQFAVYNRALRVYMCTLIQNSEYGFGYNTLHYNLCLVSYPAPFVEPHLFEPR